MFFSKIQLRMITRLLPLALLIIAGCKIQYYKTIQIGSITHKSLEAITQFKPNVIIHSMVDELVVYQLINWVLENDSLKGTIGLPIAIVAMHKLHDKSFLKEKALGKEPLSAIHIYTSLQAINYGKLGIPISSITSIEIHEKNEWMTFGMSVLATAAITTAVIYTAAFIYCGCPRVESINSQSTQFHGSLFPGSIFKSLERDDYLILVHVLTEDGNINLRISNDLPETEYIDQLQVLEVEHNGYSYLGVDNGNRFIGYNQSETSTSSVGGISNNITNTLKYRDSLTYDFDNLDTPDELNAITLSYERSEFPGQSKLIIRGKQSQWLETVANYIFLKIGKSYNNWVTRKDRSPAKRWKDKNVRQGVALNVYLKVNDKWEYVGSHHDGGTLSMRELVMDIDLTKVTSSVIEIKLESAYKIWEIDYVGITNDWSEDLTVNSLDIQKAVDHEDNDISELIKHVDDNYHIQDGNGTYVELIVKGPSMASSSIVLKGSGYYHHIRDYDHKPELKFFIQLNKKLGVQDLSKALFQYNELNIIASRKFTVSK